MNFEPRRDQAVGRIVIRLTESTIVRPDETKNTTKLLLIDAVGPGIKDLKVGDIVMPTAIIGISMEGGASFRPMAEDKNIALVVRACDAGIDGPSSCVSASLTLRVVAGNTPPSIAPFASAQ